MNIARTSRLPKAGQISKSAPTGLAQRSHAIAGVPVLSGEQAAHRSAARLERLLALVELRRLYRNLLRAELLLKTPEPVYTAPAADPATSSTAPTEPPTAAALSDADAELAERLQAAVNTIGEMQLTSEQLKAGARALPANFSFVFPGGPQLEVEASVRSVSLDYAGNLRQRVATELPLLPFPSEQQAQQAVDARNARYQKNRGMAPAGTAGPDEASPSTSSIDSVSVSPFERLEQAEKVAEKFVARRLKPAIRRARQGEALQLLRTSGAYLKGLWLRLNGAGARGGRALLPDGLPLPVSTKKEVEAAIAQLGSELDQLEKKLQDASKARENKLRKADKAGRVQLATQLKLMDAEVATLSRILAVRTLQLEMEYIYRSLEEEAFDLGVNPDGGPIMREGSTQELALLVAEFGLLDEQLTVLASALDQSSLSLVGDDILEKLALEIPDMRNRVGVEDQVVFGGSKLSLSRAKMQIKESVDKLREAIDFLLRGFRLLGADVGNMGRLFSKAALGGTLRAREVSALRRTAKDLLTFIPFTIILIVPLTPLGHVLVFGFIQRYFPGFFPSQFNTKRQEIMTRYEELKAQLVAAQAQAEMEEEEAELARAAAAVARLTAPEKLVSEECALDEPRNGDRSPVPTEAARKVQMLEEQLLEIREDVNHGILEDAEEQVAQQH